MTIIFSRSFILFEIQFVNFSLGFVWTNVIRSSDLPKFQSQLLSGRRCNLYFGK